MGEALERSALDRRHADPTAFIRDVLRDPETGRPFELFDAQRQFLGPAFTRKDDGRLLYPEQVFGAIKKSGKSMTAAMHMLTMTLVHGGRFAEGYAVANDLEQAQGRVFQAVRRIVKSSPDLKREAVSHTESDQLSGNRCYDYRARFRLRRCSRRQSGGVVIRRTLGLQIGGQSSTLGRDGSSAHAQGRLSSDDNLRRILRRIPVARRAIRARHGAALNRQQPSRRRWDLDGLAP